MKKAATRPRAAVTTDEVARCPACGTPHPLFEPLSRAVLDVASHLAVETILRKIVDSARELAGARYAALGVPDGEGSFAKFITSGITEAQWEAIGPLPRTHGLLGDLLSDPTPLRLDNLEAYPNFLGWPQAHPAMHSFLGMPILSAGQVVGAIYLANKTGGGPFTDADEAVIRLLAAHAAIALTNAELYERARELTVVEERNRLARELHDAVAQKLFSLRLTAEAAAAIAGSDAARAAAEMRRVATLSKEAIAELRDVIVELRPAELDDDGLVATLRKHVQVLRRAYGVPVDVTTSGDRRYPAEVELAALRVGQEALHNALKHASADRITVRVECHPSRLVVEVADDGVGFDPTGPVVARRLGLTSMAERARAIGAALDVSSAPGRGTTVRLEHAGG